MTNILKSLFSKLSKKQSSNDDDIVAYFNIGINKNDDVIVDGDFLDEYDEGASKIIYLLCSGTLNSIIVEWISKKCENDEERATKILEYAYNMVLEKFSKECDDEEDPVVDPRNVFRQNNNEEEMEE